MRYLRICLAFCAALALSGCASGSNEGLGGDAPPTATRPVPQVQEAPPTPTHTPEPMPAPAPIQAMTRFSIQALEGPEYRYAVVARVPGNTSVTIIGRSSNGAWMQVDLNGTPGWIAHWALEYGPDAQDAPLARSAQPFPQEMRKEVRPGSTPPIAFGYGLQAHLIGTNIEEIVIATRDLGFDWLKQQVRWKNTEQQVGNYGWRELDLIIDRTTYSDINVMFSVVAAPDWAREPGFEPAVIGPPARDQDLANFLGALADRYCGTSLRAIEVWNEQNLHYEWGNLPLIAQDYVDLLAASSAAIRSACPSMQIISGALTPAGNNGILQSRGGIAAVDDFTYLEEMLKAGVADHVDAIGAHPSGYNVPPQVVWEEACQAIVQFGNSFNGACDTPHHSWSFRSTLEGYQALLQSHGVNLPIWPTEFGWAAGGRYDDNYGYADDNTFEEQAQWTVEAYAMMKNWGWVAPPILWNLNFRVIADRTERAQWGIVNSDWSPLPVYDALKRMEK